MSDDPPLVRLYASPAELRLLMLGRPPIGLHPPSGEGFSHAVHVLRPGQSGPDAVLADPVRLPFIEAVFDRILTTTPLPKLSARAELREIWRIMAPAALALLVVKARRPWQWQAPGWTRDRLEPLLLDAMFVVHDWQTDTIPDRWHLILVGKADGWRPAMAEAAGAPVLVTAENAG
jgi:hypothetical protein